MNKLLFTLLTLLTLSVGSVFAQNSSSYFTKAGVSTTLSSGVTEIGEIYFYDLEGQIAAYDSISLALAADDSLNAVLQVVPIDHKGKYDLTDTTTIAPVGAAAEIKLLSATGADGIYFYGWHSLKASTLLPYAKGVKILLRTRSDIGMYALDPTKVNLFVKKYK